MNWDKYSVSEKDFDRLTDLNNPIPVPVGRLTANAGVEVVCTDGRQINAIYDASLGAIRKLVADNPIFKSMPNRDLLLYNDLLLNPDINTVVVNGFFGTGKTSMVSTHMVTGLQVAAAGGKEGSIPKAYISKPHVGLGKSYGHLPGDLHGKTGPEFASYTQYFDRYGQPYLADVLMKKEGTKIPASYQKIMEKTGPMLELLVFEYLRGRDIDKGWVLLDESQNTSISEMATFLARLGDGVKSIVIGDTTPIQIDRQGNTPEKNGLKFAQDTYVGKKYAGLVELQTIKHILRGQRARDLFIALKGNGG